MELAQAFCRFGSQVTALGRKDRILSKEDIDAARVVQAQMSFEGVRFALSIASFDSVTHVHDAETGTSSFRIRVSRTNGTTETFEVDQLLVATGRAPNVHNMGLEKAGVAYDRDGVRVDDYLRTTNPNIYAVGDVATRFKFTHVADFMARIVVKNALFFGTEKMSNLLIPWATYTEPEVAHVGLYPVDLDAQGIAYDTYVRRFEDVDRAILEDDDQGFVKIICAKGGDDILGATIVCSDAGDMISEISVAMRAEMGLGTLASVIHPYPTKAEAIRQAGDAYNRTRLTPTVKSIFRHLLRLRRS